ncbi:MAG TPA: fibronectin type III domain-containing protein, partial [Candidatus Acidoferrum sp.]|nr:fibronectin type III domain-containing protein [Candidatus Acidoferrum sp.]
VETVSPKLADVGTLADETAAAFSAEGVAAATLLTTRTARVQKAEQLRNVVTLYAQAMDSKYDGNVAMLQAIGLEIRNPALPVGPLPAPANVRSVAGPVEGSVTVRWNYVRGRYLYEAECAPSPAGPWMPCYQSAGLQTTCVDLTPGTEYWFRVRAVGKAGASPWSDLTRRRAS